MERTYKKTTKGIILLALVFALLCSVVAPIRTNAAATTQKASVISLKATNTTNGVKLTWKAVSGAQQYTLYAKEGSNTKAIYKGKGCTYTHNPGASGGKARIITYTVAVKTAKATTKYTLGSHVYVPATQLSAYNILDATYKPAASLMWPSTGKSVYTYKIYYKKNGTWTLLKSVPGKSGGVNTSGAGDAAGGSLNQYFDDKAVKDGQTKTYAIKVFYKYQGKTYQSALSAPVTNKYRTSPNTTATETNAAITLKWKSNCPKFEVWRAEKSSGAKTFSSFKKVKTTTAHSLTIKKSDLSKNKIYMYFVYGVDGKYQSAPGNSVFILNKKPAVVK